MKRRYFLIARLVLLLGLASCGGGGGSSGTTSPPPTASPAPPAAPTPPPADPVAFITAALNRNRTNGHAKRTSTDKNFDFALGLQDALAESEGSGSGPPRC